ncbi:hypothetical protein JTB14_003434 [Gonioctena quinquepunctata]|nr:hypothetical protein JTB14_003434 [Gonioctena quinquepunctata]
MNDIYPLEKTESCPITTKFISHYTKKIVLQSCNKLRGKQISIAQDFTQQQRAKNSEKHIFLGKQENSNECYVRGNKLVVNGVACNAEELQETNDNHNTQRSAPATPTV